MMPLPQNPGPTPAPLQMATESKPPNPALLGVVIVALVGVLIMVPAIFVFLLIAMAPTLFIAIRDRGGDMVRVQTMGSMNLAGTLPFVVKLWQKGDTLSAAMTILLQPQALMVIALSALAGGAMIWAGPVIAARLLTFTQSREADNLERINDEAVRSWGEDLLEDAERMRTGHYDG